MKKTKIIIGAFVTLSLFGANAFAQEKTSMSKEIVMSAGASVEEGLVNQLTQAKQEQEKKGFLTKLNTTLFYLGDSFSPNFGAENFRILLPTGLEKTTFSDQEVWTTEGITFIAEAHYPFISITIRRPNSDIVTTNDKDIEMSFAEVVTEQARKSFTLKELQEIKRELANRKDISWETNGNMAVLFTYKIGDKVYKKYLGQYNPVYSIRSLKKFKWDASGTLNRDIMIKDDAEIPFELSGKYELVKTHWYTREYFGFKAEIFSDSRLVLNFYNNNPLEKSISVKVVEEEGKVYLIYKNHRELIATRK